jgi:hypothetical protein
MAALHGEILSQKLLITDFSGIQYAKRFRPPPHLACRHIGVIVPHSGFF